MKATIRMDIMSAKKSNLEKWYRITACVSKMSIEQNFQRFGDLVIEEIKNA